MPRSGATATGVGHPEFDSRPLRRRYEHGNSGGEGVGCPRYWGGVAPRVVVCESPSSDTNNLPEGPEPSAPGSHLFPQHSPATREPMSQRWIATSGSRALRVLPRPTHLVPDIARGNRSTPPGVELASSANQAEAVV